MEVSFNVSSFFFLFWFFFLSLMVRLLMFYVWSILLLILILRENPLSNFNFTSLYLIYIISYYTHSAFSLSLSAFHFSLFIVERERIRHDIFVMFSFPAPLSCIYSFPARVFPFFSLYFLYHYISFWDTHSTTKRKKFFFSFSFFLAKISCFYSFLIPQSPWMEM